MGLGSLGAGGAAGRQAGRQAAAMRRTCTDLRSRIASPRVEKDGFTVLTAAGSTDEDEQNTEKI
jgi:hypothetical protein